MGRPAFLTRPAAAGHPPVAVHRTSDALDLVGKVLLVGLAVTGLLALTVPTLIVVATSFDTREFISFPPAGFSVERYAQMVANETLRTSAWTSFVAAVSAVVVDVLIAVPAAIAIVRRHFPGKAFLVGFLQSPIMLPGIVLGIAILFFYSALGVRLSLALLVLSHVVFTSPFVLRITMARMERADVRLEEAAANLGAGRWAVFRHVLLPHLAPGIVAGSAFAFLISFDNLTVSLFTAPVRQRTLPIELFFLMRFDLDPVVSAVATLQIVLTLIVFLIGARMIGTRGIVEPG